MANLSDTLDALTNDEKISLAIFELQQIARVLAAGNDVDDNVIWCTQRTIKILQSIHL